MSQSAIEKDLLSGKDLLALGDIGPCELIDRRIVPMVPTGGEHGRIEITLGAKLHANREEIEADIAAEEDEAERLERAYV